MFKINLSWVGACLFLALASCIGQATSVRPNANSTAKKEITDAIVMEVASLAQEENGNIQVELRIKNNGNSRVCYSGQLNETSRREVLTADLNYVIIPESSPIDFDSGKRDLSRLRDHGVFRLSPDMEQYEVVTFQAYREAWVADAGNAVIRPVRRGEPFALRIGVDFVECISPTLRDARKRGGSERIYVTVNATRFGRRFFVEEVE